MHPEEYRGAEAPRWILKQVQHDVAPADIARGFAKLSKGKKQHVLVKLAT